MGSVFNLIILVQNIGGLSKQFYWPRTCRIWRDFVRLQTLTTNVFRRDEDIQNRTVRWFIPILPAFAEKSLVNFGPITMDISMWNHTHPYQFFRRPYFSPCGVLHLQTFTCAREWPSLASAPSLGRGVSLRIFFKRVKIGLNLSVLAARTLEPRGVASWNFGTRCDAR